jgi:hypothetical protein
MAALVGAASFCLVLAGCGPSDEPKGESTSVPQAIGSGQAQVPVVESSYGTPVKDRVATLGFLNKRNNLTQDIVLRSGESRRIGNAVIKLATCEKTLPWEKPQEEGAFVQLFVEERANTDAPLAWHRVFSGWLFKNAPSLNVVEHPVYDVWVKSCAMKFPGEEDEASASATSAAKASARVKSAPSPAAAAPPADEPADEPPPAEEAPPAGPQ